MLSRGDLVCWRPPLCGGARRVLEYGVVMDITEANVYEGAEAKVYFGKTENFGWISVKSLSLVPDEEC